MDKPLLSPKNDFVFKRLFGDATRTAPLAAFLQATLALPPEEFAGLAIADPNLNREADDEKLCVLDVRVTTRSGRDIDVEVQVRPSSELCDRVQCYVARMVADKMKLGGSYRVAQSVSIVITDHRLWDGEQERYHHRFRLFDPEAGRAYPNSLEIHTLELPKIPPTNDGTQLWRWLRFISAETQDEFTALAGKDEVMTEALLKLMDMSVDQPTRRRAEARAKWLWDEDARLRQSRAEGEAKGRAEGRADVARAALREGMPVGTIARLTGLSPDEIRSLSSS